MLKKKTLHYAQSQDHLEKTHAYEKALEEAKHAGRPIVYMDETGFETSRGRTHGWGKIGKRVMGYVNAVRRKIVNVMGGYYENKLIAPLLFHENSTKEIFHEWLETKLLPIIKKGSVIVLDNARFHKDPKAQAIVEKASCRLLFLPPYSPHLNPIEKLWGNMKRYRKYHHRASIEDIINVYV